MVDSMNSTYLAVGSAVVILLLVGLAAVLSRRGRSLNKAYYEKNGKNYSTS